MIKYCEAYGPYSKQVLTEIDKLKAVTQEKIDSLSKKSGNVNESVILSSDEILMLEAEADKVANKSPFNANKPSPTKNDGTIKPNELTISVRLFIGSVLNAIKNKYFEYMSVLGEEL
jgi:hypothetical protein